MEKEGKIKQDYIKDRRKFLKASLCIPGLYGLNILSNTRDDYFRDKYYLASIIQVMKEQGVRYNCPIPTEQINNLTMNYKSEIEHDNLLISLTKDLDKIGNTMPIQTALGITLPLGKLETACRRQLFDVELTFNNASILIETKVDSDENGRWNDLWQTENIYGNANTFGYLKPLKYFAFITYGTSEFYTKPFNPGPACSHFVHLNLDKMITLVLTSMKLLPDSDQAKYKDWLNLMLVEQQKRSNYVSMLQAFSRFRDSYLSLHHDVDFPNNRFVFCAPELAFPLFGQIAQLWNTDSKYYEPFGKVAVYPVGRRSPAVSDSILNFQELWERGEPRLGGMTEKHGNLYFEMNEDFNLNLKIDSEVLDQNILDTVHQKLKKYSWPNGIFGKPRHYKQTTFVLYEWDYGLLKNLANLPQALDQLSHVLSSALNLLA